MKRESNTYFDDIVEAAATEAFSQPRAFNMHIYRKRNNNTYR
jgi:hypothetical protein